MSSRYIFNIRKSGLFFVFVAVYVLMLCAAASVYGEDLPLFIPGAPVPLILDPTVSSFRVAPESHPRGIRPATATVVTVNFQAAGETDYWNPSYTCETWPDDAKTAFGYAAGIWAGYLNSSIPIVIEACWTDMGSGSILGHGGAVNMWYDSPPQSWAPVTNTFYPSALANALRGTDLDESIGEPAPEIAVAFNKTFNWYFGTNGHPGTGVDFASVVLHEICHGIGFLGTMQGNSPVAGQARWGWGSGIPTAYDRFAVNNLSQSLINTSIFPNPSASLYNQVTGDNVYFNGPNARAANGNNNAKLYAPATWSSGSSYAHLDQVFNGTASALMTYSLSSGESVHAPGPVTLGILKDLGWSMNASCSYSLSSLSDSFDLNGDTGSVTVTTVTGCAWAAVSNNPSWLTVTGGSSGSGSGTVDYSVSSYTGFGSRTGTITIAGQTFTVTQTGCTYSLSPGSQPFGYNGGSNSFTVTTNGTACPWSTSETLSWVAVNSGGGPGSGTVNYTVVPNGLIASRSGNINIGDKSFMITQTGMLPVAGFSASPLSGTAPFEVTFTSSSTNATSWSWDFGDDTPPSTLQNPTHTYQAGGPYTVMLTVTNANGSNPLTKTSYISTSGCLNGVVRRTDYPDYSWIQDAYDAIGLGETDTIYVQAVSLGQSLTFGQNKNVTLRGSYTCDYSSRIPETLVIGSITISRGTVILDGISIQ